jgi:hypothetical protein
MKNKITIYVAIISIAFTSCAKKLVVTFQENSKNTGSIKLIPTKKNTASIVLNEKVLVQEQRIKSVKIKNVPYGDHKINYQTESVFYVNNLDTNYIVKVGENSDAEKAVKIPKYNKWYYIMNVGISILSLLILIL